MIAVVDDELSLRQVLTEIFADEGYEARAFASPQQCLAAADAGFRPNLVFVDLRMRGASGAEFVHAMRQTAWGRRAGIYVLSGSMLAEDFPPPGTIDGAIAKPFQIAAILDIAARHAHRTRRVQSGAS